MPRTRDANLDLLRAVAILAVVAYHILTMWPTQYPSAAKLLVLGKYGVTLFFVLSGWLIGGIFWRFRASPTNASIFGFWIRRWLRTVPPYLAGLALAYFAVWSSRGQQFDVRYLFFAQNYQLEMPFYLISWSLCVEEHFYLILPLIGSAALRMPKATAERFLWALTLLSPVLRLLDPNVASSAPFGYSRIATHLVAEGLTLGVASAFTAHHFPARWNRIQTSARYLALPALAVFASVAFLGTELEFYLGQSVVALCCFVWLAATAGQRELPFASGRFIHGVAISSYSIYLTHSLAIHLSLRIAPPSGSLFSELFCLAIWLAVVAITGATFYFGVERTSIRLRDFVSREWLSA